MKAKRRLSDLQNAFLSDHRRLIQSMTALRAALESGEDQRARELANEVDLIAGPHMEFEEQHFYPFLKPRIGKQRVLRFYREHAEGKRALTLLLDAPTDVPFEDELRQRALAGLDTALQHALGCGAVMAEIHGLDPLQQTDLLRELQVARERGRRWSEGAHPGDPEPPAL